MGKPDVDGEASTVAPPTLTTKHADLADSDAWCDDANRYVLGAEIAAGGGGRVLAATDLRLGRSVAVKVPLDREGSTRRLVREAQLIAQLEHPSIVPVHDLVRDDDGTPLYVMKLLDGETLRTRIAGRSFEERIAYLPTIVSIADAIAYAHHRGIVHRDVKPANVIVGAFGETFVIDWGLARRAGPDPHGAGTDPADDAMVTAAGAVVGTPAYMALEQARGEPVDARTDVYGIGALIYHVLCGEPPYVGATSVEVIAKLLDGPPPRISDRERRVPVELAAIVTKAMARLPDDRYASARELAADLREYQAGRLVAAHRYSPSQRARRWLQRYRAPIVATGAVAVAALAVVLAWPDRVDPREQCAASGAAVARRWPARDRARVTDRIRAFGSPGANVTSSAIESRLETYVQELARARIDACEATHVRAEQSTDLLDRQIACLAEREHDLRAAIEVLATVTVKELDGAVHAANELPAIAPCAQAALQRNTTPLPDDPTARARALALYNALTTSRTLRHLGRPAAALATARAALASTGTLPYSPYLAETHLEVGAALQDLGNAEEAQRELHLALTTAEGTRDDVRRAAALERLARWAVKHAKPDEARRRLAELSAIALRLDSPEYEASRLEEEAQLAEDLGDGPQAIALSKRALEIEERRRDPEGIATSAANIAAGLLTSGQYEQAVPYLDRARKIHLQLHGEDHLTEAKDATLRGFIYINTGRAAEAVTAYRRAREIYERAGIVNGRDALAMRANLAAAYGATGRTDEAEAELVSVLALRGDDPLGATNVLLNLGVNRYMAKEYAASEAWLRKAVAHSEKHLGATHPLTALCRSTLGSALVEQARAAEAIPLFRAALAVQLENGGEASDGAALTRAALARAYLETGQPARALEAGTPALAFFATYHDPAARGEIRWVLARALNASGRERAKGKELATQARNDFAEAADAQQVAAIDRFLAQLR